MRLDITWLVSNMLMNAVSPLASPPNVSNSPTSLIVCDTALRNGGPALGGSAQCNMACAGNPAETCGGNLRLDLYEHTGWTLIGCYTDKVSARTLSHYTTVSGGIGATTIEACQDACYALGYILAGVEYANECCKLPFLY
jgi:hypothetical protein